MKPKSTAHSRWRRLLPVLALLLLPLLTACTEEFINAALGDPVPAVDGSEGDLVTAQFDQDGGRMAIPNDLIRIAVNEALVEDGKAELTGTANNMPIRIPFNGSIDYPFATGSTPTGAELAAWGGSVFFFNTATPATIIPALTATTGGTFKAVYLDDSNDLVLVPGATTFANSAIPYAGVVTKGIKNTNGDPIEESVPMFLIKSANPLVDSDGRSVSTLVDDGQAADLELIRQGFAPLFAGLEVGGLPRANISLLFTFTVEPVDSLDPVTGTPALIAGMELQAPNAAAAAAVDLFWFDGAAFDTNFAAAVDVKSTFTDAGAPVDALASVYAGFYQCLNFLNVDAVGDFDIDKTVTPETTTCPNTSGVTGNIEFLLAKPATTTGIVIFMHGITRDKTDVAAIANTLASQGLASIAIDIWGHGTRTVSIGGTEVEFLRPDDPAKTVGYMYQTRADIQRLTAMALNNTELFTTALGSGGVLPVYFVGQSLGSIIGSLAMSSGTTAFTRAVLSVPGADLVDIVLKGEIGAELVAAVAADQGQEVGSPELNATLLGIELTSRHALFSGLVDPLALYDPATPTTPATVLVQQMGGDGVIGNDNTELLSLVMGLVSHSDGAGPNADLRSRWVYDPANYSPDSNGGPAGHGFLLDGETSATTQGQTQAVTYLLGAGVIDPSE